MINLNTKLIEKFKTIGSPLNGWYKIDKTFATYLLGLNVNNYRNYNKGRVASWAEDMKNGKWIKNGETIVIGKNGIIQDGQHRLLAVLESDSEIEAFIVFDAEVTGLYDFNLVRTVKTMFDHEKIPVDNLVVAIGRMVMVCGTASIIRGNATVHDYISSHLDDIKLARSIVNTGYSYGKGVALKAACATIVYCLLRSGEMTETEMRSFFRTMNTGKKFGCAKDVSAAKVLRRQFLEMRGGGRALQRKQLEITYKALRDFRLGNHRVGEYDGNTSDAVRLIKQIMVMDHIDFPDAA